MDRVFSEISKILTYGEPLPPQIVPFRMLCIAIVVSYFMIVMPMNSQLAASTFLNPTVVVYAILILVIYLVSLRGIHLIKSAYILTLFFLSICWLLKGGSKGSISYFYLSTAGFSILLFRNTLRIVMFFLILLNYAALIFIEWRFPSLTVPFLSANDQYLDLVTGFVINVLITVPVIHLVVTSKKFRHKRNNVCQTFSIF
jgi:hypothetical protein